jgi:hypothetical protein
MTDMALYCREDGLLEAGDDETMAYIKSMKPAELVVVKAPAKNAGTIPMLRTWRGWMAETAKFMAWQGCTQPLYIRGNGEHVGSRPFNANDAHELFTAQWLGVDENGKRYSWAVRTKDTDCTVAPKSRRLYAMDRHLAWATDRGINLMIPRNSEYEQLTKEQNK